MSQKTINSPMVTTGRPVAHRHQEQENPWPTRDQGGTAWANKADLADCISERLKVSRKRGMRILDTVLSGIGDLLQEKRKVAVKGFGTFEGRTRKGRAYKHPKTGENVVVPDKGTVVFKASKKLLDLVHDRKAETTNPELVYK